MIKYLTRNEINIKKYDDCISKAYNSRIYAFSWYLDIVAHKNWGVLVLKDYKAVMPLPKRKKYFISYVFLPSWIQQLGVFSEDRIDQKLITKFIKKIPKRFKLIDVFLNSENIVVSKNITTRINYVLKLNKPFEELYKNYKKGRKSSIKLAQNYNLKIVGDFNYEEIIQLFKGNKGVELNKNSIDYTHLSDLIKYALSLNFAESLAIVNEEEELIGGAFFLKNKKRITYFFSAINEEGRDKQAMSFLINYVIKKFSNSDYIFDFEGSMVEDIASFFKSFGSEIEEYYHLKKYQI